MSRNLILRNSSRDSSEIGGVMITVNNRQGSAEANSPRKRQKQQQQQEQQPQVPQQADIPDAPEPQLPTFAPSQQHEFGVMSEPTSSLSGERLPGPRVRTNHGVNKALK